MEAKELRIGNYLNFEFHKDSGGIEKVGVFLSDIENLIYGGNRSKYYTPIPLTEEWLLKFGFVKDKKHNNCCDLELENNFYLQGVGYGKSNIKYEVILTDSNDNELTLVKHVHQLQNLYFALTNEELTIK